MSCRRAFEIDLAAFLHEPRDARWDDFRAHYPRCAACAAEVAAWTALETMLAPPHPGEETLRCWARERDALDAATRASVERHLARCPSCTEELRVLERFAAGPKEGAGHELRRHEARVRPAGRRVDHAATRGATATSHAQGRPRRGAPGVLRRVLRHPALPWAALVVLLLLPTFRERFQDAGGPPPPR
ncbi:MAG: zf-HC2 domain-containing protein, partial [Thermodesulfobacteriota bacterium]